MFGFTETIPVSLGLVPFLFFFIVVSKLSSYFLLFESFLISMLFGFTIPCPDFKFRVYGLKGLGLRVLD